MNYFGRVVIHVERDIYNLRDIINRALLAT